MFDGKEVDRWRREEMLAESSGQLGTHVPCSMSLTTVTAVPREM